MHDYRKNMSILDDSRNMLCMQKLFREDSPFRAFKIYSSEALLLVKLRRRSINVDFNKGGHEIRIDDLSSSKAYMGRASIFLLTV